IHEGRSPFVCNMLDDESNECRAGFETAGKLKAHEGRVHGGERFWCITCSSEGQPNSITDDGEGQRDGVAFSTYAALQTHIKTDHPPTCGECGLQCSSQRELKIHVEVQHGIFGVEERRTHICDEVGCGRGFTKKGNLAVHMRTVHNGERRFVCGNLDLKSLKKVANWDGQGACGWAFSSKGNLEEHIRTAHLGLQNNRNAKKDNNNDHPRRSANRQRQVSALTRLTGSGYEAESGQDIACLQEGCDYLFARGIDLEIHLQNHHGLANLEIQILLTKHDNSVKEYSRDGFQNLVSTVAEDFEAERALDGQFVDDTTMEDDLDDAAARGGSFWIGGNYGGEGNHGGDDWLRDELEMQELIGDESEDEAMIDPALLQNS
ncbi:Strongly-conserved Zn-finger binding protein (TFIIIA), partial [Toensbergia leucococca]|nr:Strongly-conserved Zn-finger binding protein (TFIIIA) [Toensbergia leucococca]